MKPNDSAMFIPSPANKMGAIENERKEDKSVDQSEIKCDGVAPSNEERKKTIQSLETIPSEELVTEKMAETTLLTEKERDDTVPERSDDDDDDDDDLKPASSIEANGVVSVVPLGFVKNMAEYMVAADVLISKAGPGTISEAAALSLPVMLTSFLPGQEEGNVDYVVEGGFGSFCQDTDTGAVAEEVALWLKDEVKLREMSEAAKKAGHPYAARDIVKQIGDSTLKWKSLNDGHFTEIINDLDDEEQENEAIAKIIAEEEKINADIIASAELTAEGSSEIDESEAKNTI